MDASFAVRAIGDAMDGLFRAIFVGLVLLVGLFVTVIAMGIYIYVH